MEKEVIEAPEESVIGVDCETYSELDVREVGSLVYSRHKSTKVLMWSVMGVGWARPLVFEVPNIWKLLYDLKKAGLIKWSKNSPLTIVHWGPFDRQIAQACCIHDVREKWGEMDEVGVWHGPNNTLWGDLSEVSLLFGAPQGLKSAAKFWAGAEPKDDGKHLIHRFCKPDKKLNRQLTKYDDPIRWEKFRSYAGQDSAALMASYDTITEMIEKLDEDLEAHDPGRAMVASMNIRGIPLDLASIERANEAIKRNGARLVAHVEGKHGIKLTAPGQIANFLGTEDATKETLEALLENDALIEAHREVVAARLVVAGAANKKLQAMLNRVDEDGRLRGAFIYHGAWTRRMTSQGVQVQNFVRQKSEEAFFAELGDGTYDESLEIFARVRGNIRGFIKAPEKMTFVAADYAQIELRVGAWLAGEEWLIEALETGQDVYRITAGKLFSKKPKDVSQEERQLGKIVELAALYGLSAKGFDGDGGLYARLQQEGLGLSRAFCERTIDIYRSTHPNIVKMWDDCDNALYRLVHAKDGVEIQVRDLRFKKYGFGEEEGCITLERPSGFRQFIWFPRFKEESNGTKVVYTGRQMGGGMGPMYTYGSKLFQGATQGTAADLIYHGGHAAERGGYAPIMAVHDELVTEVPTRGSYSVDELCEIICDRPKWAKGLPIKAEGWKGTRFTK